jgi:hypothetical protein
MNNLEKQSTLGTRQGRRKTKSRMNNLETQSTLSTRQERRKTKEKQNQE